MPETSPEYAVLNWFGQVNYALMEWSNDYWWPVLAGMIFIGCLIGMSPLSTHHEQPFHQILFVWIRKTILWLGVGLFILPFVMLYLYDMTMQNQLADSQQAWLSWFINLAKQNWFVIFSAATSGWLLRFMYKRYTLPIWSAMLRRLRNKQTEETPTDIREEISRFDAKDFLPQKHYKENYVLVGLDEKDKPIHIPTSTWYETNMQVVGPTRYGKGVIMGAIMDQAIRRGDCLFYIDPKKDKFAPHVMYQACIESGRKFYYVTLHDEGIGKWAPFVGGSDRDGLTRLEAAFGLEFTGNPGTDYYKSQERKELEKAFKKTRNIEGLKNIMEETEANRINAELARWSNIESLCPKKGGGFSIGKALKEGAVVYVQGSLDDSVVKTATKTFITELIQEARQHDKERNSHLTAVIDEVSFLASKTLAQALATAVGFRVNFVLAYQSQNDLLNIDDQTVNPKYVYQSINVNSQIKAVYGGADFETAEWAANLSGTITKEVTKMEKTDISATGGETWEQQRTVGTLEENYINTNMVLTLPPRVCVFVQPRHLASICFSSFIPVKDMKALDDYLDHKDKVYNAPTTQETDDQLESDNSGIDTVPEEFSQPEKNEKPAVSQAKPKEKKTSKENKDEDKTDSVVLPFRGKKETNNKVEDNSVSQEKPEVRETIENTDFFEDQEKQPKQNTEFEKTGKPSISQSKPEPQENEQRSDLDNEPSEEEIKKRERNRARKSKQKAKKNINKDSSLNNVQTDKPVVSQAKPDLNNNEQSPDLDKVDTVELSDDFALDFGELDLQSDDKTMSLLSGLDEDEEK
ncbi:TraM recognition domain-containing protein [Vibrio anguillarum]|uniref:TraM recognition domain-containing protein n=1 Tax=Vibrio anguillarum TaxID=55601 RepID=UPI00031ADD0A|nr:TraM recognition domain-containing protein [Vibrio anguillarum]